MVRLRSQIQESEPESVDSSIHPLEKITQQFLEVPSENELNYIYQNDLANVGERVACIRAVVEQQVPLQILQGNESFLKQLPMDIDAVITLAEIWDRAYTQAQVEDRKQYSPKDTVQPYGLEDMRQDVYEYVSQEEFPQLEKTPIEFWQSLRMVREFLYVARLELKWAASFPTMLEYWQEEFAVPLQESDITEVMKYASEAVPNWDPYTNETDAAMPATKPWENTAVREWWLEQQNTPDSPTASLRDVLGGDDSAILRMVFHRYCALKVGGASEKDLAQYMQEITLGRTRSKDDEVEEFLQVDAGPPPPVSFKLHVRGRFSLMDLESYDVLVAVKEFCKKNNLSWKVRLPVDPHSDSLRGPNSRYDGTWITVYLTQPEDAKDVLDAEEVQRIWEESIALGKQLDELLAEFGQANQVQRSPSDWLLTSSEKSSGRVQVRFGENTSNKEKRAKYLGDKAGIWNDSRKRRFENNLLYTSPEELQALATEIGVTVQPYDSLIF